MKIGEFYQNTLKKYKNSQYINEIVLRSIIINIEKIETMSKFFLTLNDEIKSIEQIDECLKRVESGEPYQYVLKEAYFCGDNFYVDKNVLIPRMETEELVRLVINDNKKCINDLIIADIGTGSGCIAIAIKKIITKSIVFASDISNGSIKVASFNASIHGVEIKFLQGNMLEPYFNQKLKIDIIVSNPPYIKEQHDVEKSVLHYEPHLALFAKNGIDYYLEIFKHAPKVLKDGAKMYFEINYDQKEVLTSEIMKALPNSTYEFFKDDFGLWRILKINYRE